MTRWIIAGFVAVAVAEHRRPLRKRVERALPHIVRDLAAGALSAGATAALQRAFVAPGIERAERENLGLLRQCRMPRWMRTAAGVLLLDYTLWIWHSMNHRLPLLWRFHRVHHVDRDLDTATALRFHFGEMALSVFFRAAQVRLLGADREAIALWQALLLLSIFFHHSNLELPPDIERALARLIATPRLHGIHHSDVQSESQSNLASLFTVWDFLHGTFRDDVPQESITIGVPAYGQPEDVTLGKILLLPARDTDRDWIK